MVAKLNASFQREQTKVYYPKERNLLFTNKGIFIYLLWMSLVGSIWPEGFHRRIPLGIKDHGSEFIFQHCLGVAFCMGQNRSLDIRVLLQLPIMC